MLDLDQRAEEEALLGKQVNPPGVDYSCLCWSPDSVGMTDSASAVTIGWHPPLSLKRLEALDFKCNAQDMQQQMQAGMAQLYTQFQQDVLKPETAQRIQEQVGTLDPIQHEV